MTPYHHKFDPYFIEASEEMAFLPTVMRITGMTIHEVANQMGCSSATLIKASRAEAPPSEALAKKFHSLYGHLLGSA